MHVRNAHVGRHILKDIKQVPDLNSPKGSISPRTWFYNHVPQGMPPG